VNPFSGVVLALGALQEPSALPRCAEGWKLEVVAQSPRVRHPTVVCCAPDGRVFVGEDPIDMEGPLDQPVDRIVCPHPDGHTTIFAEHLGPVFGMLYPEGKLYVQHVPKFSVFSDQDGVGRDRRDLIECTNPTPSAGNGLNDHIPSNFHLGMDGYFYVSVGQKGIYGAVGSDGRRFDMREGGIFRMRPDATELEIYARGVRNILDLAMNAEDDLFVYDNDDHTKAWKVKLLHVVEGGYYGFPWDFKPSRPYTLGAVHEFPGGAPTGVLAYTEDALPPEDEDALILCDWGNRTVQRARLTRDGATYRLKPIEDLIPAGPSDFRPVGIALSPDGMGFYVTDWNFAGWKQKKEAGRLFKLSRVGPSRAAPKPAWYLPSTLGRGGEIPLGDLLVGLRHPAKSVRLAAERRIAKCGTAALQPLVEVLADPAAAACARRHAVWAADAIDQGLSARSTLLRCLRDPALRLQVIRQVGMRRVKEAAGPLSELLGDPAPEVRFQAATALGRIADPAVLRELEAALADPDALVRYGAFTALHRIGLENPSAWVAIGRGLRDDRAAVREGTLFSMRETYEEPVVSELAQFVRDVREPGESRAAALWVLAELERRPPPWDGRWWRNGPYAFLEDHPTIGPRIDKTLEWPGTALVREALRLAQGDPSPLVRAAAITRPPARPPAPTATANEIRPPIKAVLPGATPEAYASFASLHPGDATRGRSVFLDAKGVACARCHRVQGQGGELGPDLSGVGMKYDRAFLIESILYPSKQISEGFAQTMVRMRDGRVFSGLLRGETSDELTLVDSEGKLQVLRTTEIDRRKVSDQSLMPENLQAALSLEEFADLVAYLAALQDTDGFVPLFSGKDFSGWKKDPANQGHWTAKEGGTLFYDGKGKDLWTEGSYANFVLKVDWRWPPVEAGGKPPVEKDAPVILPDGSGRHRNLPARKSEEPGEHLVLADRLGRDLRVPH
jgi:putative heme-binding domain-containing protein